jgi:hypothetical protein
MESGAEMGVVVDNNSAPYILGVSAETPYIFTGNAPIANSGYKYVRMFNGSIQESESFIRSPVQKNTYNEFYNRSFNTYSLPSFPQLYPPLSSIHRIKSELHQDDQIPSFFFYGNEAGIANMHSNPLDKSIKVDLNLVYIG